MFPYVYNIQPISIPLSILYVDVKTACNHSESDKTMTNDRRKVSLQLVSSYLINH